MDEKEKECCDNNKDCKNKDKSCKKQNLEQQIEDLTKDLELARKTIEEQKSTISNYLATASYYKNEVDNQKKDFERYKERNKNILDEANQKANENIAKKILPIIDNFDQAIAHVDPDIMRGFAMIYGSLINVLTDLGIVEIKTNGEKLNPELHNCISTEETNNQDLDDTIANVYQKGYIFADSAKVVRPATVSVYKVSE